MQLGRRMQAGSLMLCLLAVGFITRVPMAKAAPTRADSSVARPDSLAAARELIRQGKFADAEGMARRALASMESVVPADSTQVGDALDVLVQALWRGGKAETPDARGLAGRAVTLRERMNGSDHPSVAKSLNNLANLLLRAGDVKGARQAFERALAIREKALGPDHPDVATTLSDLGTLVRDADGFAASRPYFERALAIREKALGPNHPDVARSLDKLGMMHLGAGEYGEARPLLERALAIREKALGPDHPDVAASLNNLAVLLIEYGDFAGGRPLVERSLGILERQRGPNDPDFVVALHNLASIDMDLGDYTAARPLLERALATAEKVLGPDDWDVAWSLEGVAGLLVSLGDYAEAQPLYERALAIHEKDVDSDHRDVATTLDYLGNVHRKRGDLNGARRSYERALAIHEKSLGPEHATVGYDLANLANTLRDAGDFRTARSLYERAVAISEKALGPDNPGLGNILHEFATMLARSGDNAGALRLYERALDIRRRAGPDNPLAAETEAQLARTEFAVGHTARGLQAALHAEEVGRQHLRLTARGLAERQALGYAAVRPAALEIALSATAGVADAESRQKLFDSLIRSRAIVLDEMASRHAERGVEDSTLTALRNRLVTTSARYANLLVRGPGSQPAARFTVLLGGARGEKEDAERALAARSAAFREENERADLGFQEVASALPAASALVSYFRYERRSGRGRAAMPAYVAFVLTSGGGAPEEIQLGPAAPIDSLVARWRAEFTPAAVPAEVGGARYRITGTALRRSVWDPVAARLSALDRVFVVPDGALSLVSLSTLPIGRSEYLIEKGPLIHYLSAERDLVPARDSTAVGHGLLAFGGADFDAGPGDGAGLAAAASASPLARETAYRGSHSSCEDFRTVHFPPLPATLREVADVASEWRLGAGTAADRSDVKELTGAAATENAFRQYAPGRRVVHVATHGFFLTGSCLSATDRTRGIGGLAGAAPEQTSVVNGDNPLLLSGLALGGANQRDHAGNGKDDGILTAEEIAALDLSGVEWAVLSACQTGVGEVRAGEGVLGLRRAFEMAGARTLIMSLWEVEDTAARDWMRRLYEGRLARHLGTAEAVREASLGLLGERRRTGRSTHPYYWGAFVAAGDWR